MLSQYSKKQQQKEAVAKETEKPFIRTDQSGLRLSHREFPKVFF